jgi:hypothetical protein
MLRYIARNQTHPESCSGGKILLDKLSSPRTFIHSFIHASTGEGHGLRDGDAYPLNATTLSASRKHHNFKHESNT